MQSAAVVLLWAWAWGWGWVGGSEIAGKTDPTSGVRCHLRQSCLLQSQMIYSGGGRGLLWSAHRGFY